MPHTNQYLLRADLALFQSDFPDEAPHRTAAVWHDDGWGAAEHQGMVRVFHGLNAPRPLDEAMRSVPVVRQDRHWGRTVSAVISQALVRRGYIPRRDGGYMHPLREAVEGYPPVKGLKLGRHRTWHWDIEEDGEVSWLVPHLTWTKLTLQPALALAAQLSHRFPERRWTLFHRRTGELHTHQHLQDPVTLERCEDLGLAVLIPPRAEDRDWGTYLQMLQDRLQDEPAFAQVADVSALREVVPGGTTEGHLVIKKTRIEDRRQVLKRPVHRRPDRPLQVITVLPEDPSRDLLNALTVQLRNVNEVSRRALPIPQLRLEHLWTTVWKLQPYALHHKALYYQRKSGQIQTPDVLLRAVQSALRSGRRPVVLAVTDDMDRKMVQAQLLEGASGTPHILVKAGTLIEHGPKTFPYRSCITSLALQLLHAAGGVPWALQSLPGVQTGTLFLGLDLSHDHQRSRSVLAAVLVRPSGEVLTSHTFEFDRNDERIPSIWWTCELPAWLEGTVGRSLPHVIVHRDGRFLEGEIDDVQVGLAHVGRLELVAVKKDSGMRVDGSATAEILLMGPSRALVTPSPGMAKRTGKPLELECHSGGDVVVLARQVALLAHMRFDDIYGTVRLPITTHLAHRLARRHFQEQFHDEDQEVF